MFDDICFEPEMDVNNVANAIYFHISTISDTNDIDTIKTCLDCIYYLTEGIFDVTRDKIKEHIINGIGIFNTINKKCIDLKVI